MPRRPETTPFARPLTPVAQCLHLIREHGIVTRPELIKTTGLSQPTITRAVSALLSAGLVRSRQDLTIVRGPGRPTTPLGLAEFPAVFVGAAVGTSQTYLGIYDARGRQLSDATLRVRVAELSAGDFLEHLVAGINRILAGTDRPLGAVGVATSGWVSEAGAVTAPNLGWHQVDFATALEYHFDAPVTVAAATPAILGAETQYALLPEAQAKPPRTLAFFADDSIAAAITHPTGVRQLEHLPGPPGAPMNPRAAEELLSTSGVLARAAEYGISASTLAHLVELGERDKKARSILDARARGLAQAVVRLIEEHRPDTVVLAGSAFTKDRRAPRVFAQAVRRQVGHGLSLRIIPGHAEILAAVTRAVALDTLVRDPLAAAHCGNLAAAS